MGNWQLIGPKMNKKSNELSSEAQSKGNNFLDLYGNLTLNQITSNWQEVPLSSEDDAWSNFPPEDFLEFARKYPKTPFDSIPSSDQYLKDPTYFISQVHRLWVTTSFLYKKIIDYDVKSLLDLGSFPFFTPLILRDYFRFSGGITVTTNLELSKEANLFLESKGINVCKLDLDPHVHDPASIEDKLPASLSNNNELYDLILSSHVIEHLYHPKIMLHECSRLLKHKGCILITTDNAMMIDVFTNYIGGYGYIFEPVKHTAAMNFNFWRGHVRFFTNKDLILLLKDAGFSSFESDYFQCFYDVFFEDYFKNPIPALPGWKKRLLEETPWLRNDVAVFAQKL